MDDFSVFSDEAEELDRAGRLAVVEGDMDVVEGLAFCGIVFPGLHHYA